MTKEVLRMTKEVLRMKGELGRTRRSVMLNEVKHLSAEDPSLTLRMTGKAVSSADIFRGFAEKVRLMRRSKGVSSAVLREKCVRCSQILCFGPFIYQKRTSCFADPL